MKMKHLIGRTAAAAVMAVAATGIAAPAPLSAQTSASKASDRVTPQQLKNLTYQCKTNRITTACYAVAQHFLTYPKGPSINASAHKYMQMGCELPIRAGEKAKVDRFAAGRACLAYGRQLKDGFAAPGNLPASLKAFERGCGHGNMISCASAGEAYNKARGVEENIPKALEFYRKSCSRTLAVACFQASRMMLKKGLYRATASRTDPDYIWAREISSIPCSVRWKSQAAGCWYLGQYRERGLGGEKDISGALYAYNIACRDGKKSFCYWQGKLLRSAPEPLRDEARGRALLTKACNEGKSKAACNAKARWEKAEAS